MPLNVQDEIRIGEGDQIGRFVVTKVLRNGRGGFAQVCLARDGSGNTVALKIALQSRFNDTIVNESGLLTRLDHRNIVRILPIVPDKRIYTGFTTKLRSKSAYLALEHLEGDSLETYLRHKGRLAIHEPRRSCGKSPTLAACQKGRHLSPGCKPDNICFVTHIRQGTGDRKWSDRFRHWQTAGSEGHSRRGSALHGAGMDPRH